MNRSINQSMDERANEVTNRIIIMSLKQGIHDLT